MFKIQDWKIQKGVNIRSGLLKGGLIYKLDPLTDLNHNFKNELYPTPRARDWKDVGNVEKVAALLTRDRTLPRYIAFHYKIIPSCEFVEWLMGYPIGWTDLTKESN